MQKSETANNLKGNLTVLQQKARERTVKTQNIEYDLETLVKKIDKKLIKLDPDYQRRHRWTPETSSRLIESLILNIPIPLIYLSQDVDVDEEVGDEGTRYSVIDGQQRLTAIVDFMANKFALRELETLTELNDAFYKDLPPFLIRRLEERSIKCLRIDSTVDAQVKYDIFQRLNSGSVKLEPQELRNAIYRGSFNTMLKEAAQDDNFRALLNPKAENPEESRRVQKMEDVELVLRFLALRQDKYKFMRKGLKNLLDEEMERMNKKTEAEQREAVNSFVKTMAFIQKHFGDSAFAKYRAKDGKYKLMSSFNAATYDALSVAADSIIQAGVTSLSPAQIANYKSLFADPEFFGSIEGSTNDRSKIIHRIDAVKGVLK